MRSDEVGPSEPLDGASHAVGAPTRRRRPHGYGLVLLTIVLAIVIASIGEQNLVTQSVWLLLIGASLLLALRTAEVHPGLGAWQRCSSSLPWRLVCSRACQR